VRALLPWVLLDKLPANPQSAFFQKPENQVYLTDRVSWIQQLFDRAAAQHAAYSQRSRRCRQRTQEDRSRTRQGHQGTQEGKTGAQEAPSQEAPPQEEGHDLQATHDAAVRDADQIIRSFSTPARFTTLHSSVQSQRCCGAFFRFVVHGRFLSEEVTIA
jgi:hypothetical protein